MAMLNEITLLRRFVEKGDQEAFAEVVRRRVDFVYSAALRQVGRDAHLAQDVTQGVFLALARGARSLAGRPVLTGWFYTTTRFLAAKAVRSHRRWQDRTQEAHTMNEIQNEAAGEPDWAALRPVLDDAMHELGDRDREAVLLRYFENRPFADIATACGLNENSARMRVERALEKLRLRLSRHGITSTTTALAVALSTQTIVAAPAGLAAAAANTSLVAAGASSAALHFLEFMSMTKAKIALAGAVAAVLAVGGYYVGQERTKAEWALRTQAADLQIAELVRQRDENARLNAAGFQQAREFAALREEHQQLVDQVRELTAAGTSRTPASGAAGDETAGDEPLSPVRTLADLQKRKLVDARMTFIDRQGKIGDAFAELFHLTADEREVLQQEVERVRQQLDVAALAHAKASQDDAGNLVVEIPPLTGGAELYDQLLDSFAQTLGPDRNALFFDLGTRQVEEALNSFGAEQRTLTVRRGAAPTEGAANYTVTDSRKTKDGSRTSTSNPGSRARLAASLGAIAQLLPPEF